MQKILYSVLILFSFTSLFAQKQVERVTMPTKDDKVFYEQIVDVKNPTSKDELFLRSSKWIANKFLDSKEAVKFSDKESGKIVGKGLFTIIYNKFGKSDDYVSFDFEITVKDSKYRIQIYGIETKGIDSDYPFSGIEFTYFRQLKEDKFSYRNSYVQTCREIDKKIVSLMDDLKTVMNVDDDF